MISIHLKNILCRKIVLHSITITDILVLFIKYSLMTLRTDTWSLIIVSSSIKITVQALLLLLSYISDLTVFQNSLFPAAD